MPSKPRMTSRCEYLLAGRRAAEEGRLGKRDGHCDGNNGEERGDERSRAHVLGL